MQYLAMRPNSLSLVFFVHIVCCAVSGQNIPASGLNFGDLVTVLGNTQETSAVFQDGLFLDIISPTTRSLTVQQNVAPLTAQFVTGPNGVAEGFIALSSYSYVVETSGPANDLVAEVAIQYDPLALQNSDVQPVNTYVAVLSPDKRSWLINESTRSIQRSDNRTASAKLSSIDGEYMLLGRPTSTALKSLAQSAGSGSELNDTAALIGGPANQEAEFKNGLRLSVQSEAALLVTVTLDETVNPGTLNDDIDSLNTFTWIVRTSNHSQDAQATMSFPFNRTVLLDKRPNGASPTTMLSIGRRPLNATSGTFLPFHDDRQVVKELPDDRIEISGVKQLDGQYLMMITLPKNIKTGKKTSKARRRRS